MEVQWAEMLREYPMGWRELQEMPLYPRRVLWDLLVARREEEKAANERASGG